MRRNLPKGKVLRPVHPNAGIRAAYRKRLLALVDEMTNSYRHWIEIEYRKTPPTIAQDELSSRALQKTLRLLARRWKRNFDEAADNLASYFATRVENRSRRTLMNILKDGGWTVEFKLTAGLRDVMSACVAENVSLIKSIPQHFHTQVEGLVMRSVASGRDLAPLVKDLQKQFGVTRRRAEFIALDQSNKATAQITQARYIDLGITQAIWLHSGGGKTKRPTHVKQSGKPFDIKSGWYDPDPKVKAYIQPGSLPNCRCVCKPVVKGFT